LGPEEGINNSLLVSICVIPIKPTTIFSVYNIGVEVRQGTGRYKNTQVVLLTPRYRINNQSSHKLYLSKREDIYVGLLSLSINMLK